MLDDMLRSDGQVLARFTRDLTADARTGRLEPVRCRADEIARVVDILLRHGKNNPALVGPSGVGKTAIVEGLAQRMARGDVPLSLRGMRILAVDHVSLLAGTTYRGQYEERIRGLVAETSAAPDVILFVDELHNLIGQGTAMGAAMDAANMLKPALVRGEFRVIGATTSDEYERWVCGDPALERRFQKITVRELTEAETLEILEARRERLERHHNVVIADDAIAASIKLTDLFLTDRMRPDRALDALDEACAHAHATALYSAPTEALIRAGKTARAGAKAGAQHRAAARAHERAAAADELDESADDSLDRFARDGLAALERFGAELEAMFVGDEQPAQPAASPAARDDAPGATPSASRDASADSEHSVPAFGPSADAAGRTAELRRRLIEEGIVVRGHDVARVVGLSTGRHVQWEE